MASDCSSLLKLVAIVYIKKFPESLAEEKILIN